MPGKFKSYMRNILANTGKRPEDFLNLVNEEGFIKERKIAAKHGELLTWLKTDKGLGHVQANFIILYLRSRANDQRVSEQAKKWVYETGFL